MQICEKCLLCDNIPSVKINSSGICNYCTASDETRTNIPEVDEEFSALLDKYKNRKYQVVMAYSGGKDSTYVLKLIKEKYDASILAITFNNGFISESSLRNINTVTDYLGIDSMVVKYPTDKLVDAFRFAQDYKIFPGTSLERASSICNLCIMLIKNMVYYEAILRNIPIICFGWTPGQVETDKPLLKLNHHMVSKVFDKTKNSIVGGLGSGYDKYFLNAGFLEENEDRIPYLYYPFVKDAYDEKKIIDEIRQIGWSLPENTDGNSSNCLLNSYANQIHIDQFGYHPYAFEISSMVRSGYMTREEGAAKLQKVKNDSSYELIKKRFQTAPSQIL